MEDTAAGASRSMIDRAFLASHLLTGSIRQAEDAAMAAIDSWNPDKQKEEALFQNVLDAAARAHSNSPDESDSFLPKELKAVLKLSRQLRRCFVLRILAGFSSEACARMLGLQSARVDEYTCAALQSLSARRCDRLRPASEDQN